MYATEHFLKLSFLCVCHCVVWPTQILLVGSVVLYLDAAMQMQHVQLIATAALKMMLKPCGHLQKHMCVMSAAWNCVTL